MFWGRAGDTALLTIRDVEILRTSRRPHEVPSRWEETRTKLWGIIARGCEKRQRGMNWGQCDGVGGGAENPAIGRRFSFRDGQGNCMYGRPGRAVVGDALAGADPFDLAARGEPRPPFRPYAIGLGERGIRVSTR